MYGLLLVDPKDGPLASPPTLLGPTALWGPHGRPPQPTSTSPPSTAASLSRLLPPASGRTPDGRPLREFAVLQSEFYHRDAAATPALQTPSSSSSSSSSSSPEDLVELDYSAGLDEKARSVVFNGKEGALTERPLVVAAGDRVRLYVGNAGPNLTSSFHVIGTIFDAVWRDGDVHSPPARGLQTVLIPPGGVSIVEFDALVPGTLTIVDHAIFRTDKGAVGFVKVVPPAAGSGGGRAESGRRPDLYASAEPLAFCPGCKMHN